jgi:hypothetical protein
MGIDFVDRYSLLHFAVGIVVYYFDIGLFEWFLIHTLFEIIENSKVGVKFINNYLIWFWPGGKDKADSVINSVGDVFFGLLGWIVAYLINNKNWLTLLFMNIFI